MIYFFAFITLAGTVLFLHSGVAIARAKQEAELIIERSSSWRIVHLMMMPFSLILAILLWRFLDGGGEGGETLAVIFILIGVAIINYISFRMPAAVVTPSTLYIGGLGRNEISLSEISGVVFHNETPLVAVRQGNVVKQRLIPFAAALSKEQKERLAALLSG